MSADDQMPDRLGPYRLLDRIGEGGMGVVYLARDRQHRTVAVKVLRAGASDPNALRRLAREVATMRRVRSPFVAEVIDEDLAGDLPYIVTRYVPGHTLDQVVSAQGPLRGPVLAGLARGLADALAAVHAAGVVHRDLKPGNVMMVGGSPVVIDFGIAQGPDASRLTMTGMFMGTPGYLAPEVIEGQPSSEASDVHAWGATVAFAATGRPPFGSGGYEAIFYRILNGQPDLEGAPPTLLPLLAAAMAREPSHRPPAVQLGALASVLDPRSLVPGPAAGQRPAASAGATQAAASAAGQPLAGAADGFAGAAAAAAGLAAGLGLPATAAPGGQAGAGLAGAAPGVGNGAAPGVPGAATGLGNGAAPGLAGAAPGLANGAAPAARLAARAVAGNGAGPGAPAAAFPPSSAAAAAALRPGDYADVLPPVGYPPPGAPPYGPPGRPMGPPGAGLSPDRAARASPRGHALLAYVSMVILIGVSVLLPVAGALSALALIALLRAGDGARRGAAIRRSTHGARATDPLVAAMSFPWHLVRSVLRLLVLSPIAAAVGALVAGVSLIAVQVDRVPHAIAFGAGAVVGFYALGPGSARPRHQLAHLYARLTPNRTAQAVALLAVIALAAGAVTAAASSPPLYSPIPPPGSIGHLPDIKWFLQRGGR